jgi:hypothetical protein
MPVRSAVAGAHFDIVVARGEGVVILTKLAVSAVDALKQPVVLSLEYT